MKQKLILFTFIVLTLNVYSQNIDKYFKYGTKLLEEGNYKKADSLFSISLRRDDNRECFYNRGVAKLYLKDTISFCNDMYVAGKLGDYGARNLFLENCLKTDSIANANFIKGLQAYNQSYYNIADSFFTKSYNEIPTFQNIYYSYLTKLELQDTLYAYFMLHNLFAYNQAIDSLIQECEYASKISTTRYYNNKFTEEVKFSDNKEVVMKMPNYCVGEYSTKDNPYLARYIIKDSIKYFTRTDKVKFKDKEIYTYIENNSIFPPEVNSYFDQNDFVHVYIIVYYKLNGEIFMELKNRSDLNYLLLNKIKLNKERDIVIESLTSKAKDILSKIPETPSFWFKGKPVNFCITYKIRFRTED